MLWLMSELPKESYLWMDQPILDDNRPFSRIGHLLDYVFYAASQVIEQVGVKQRAHH